MASNPLFIIPDFFCTFPMNFAMATLGLKEMVPGNRGRGQGEVFRTLQGFSG